MPKSFRILLIISLLPFLEAFAQEEVVFDLNAISRKYSDTWRVIENRQAERMSALKGEYIAAIEEYEKKAMGKGELDEVLAARAEKDRLLQDRGLTPADREAMLASLLSLLDQYEKKIDRITAESRTQLRSLHERYMKSLDTQERKLTSQGKLDEALAIRAEKERVKDHLPVDASAPASAAAGEAKPAAGPAQGKAGAKVPGGVKLSPNWNVGARAGSLILSDMRELLQPVGKPAVDLAPGPTLFIFDKISYLMTASEAAATLGQRLSSRTPINSPPFPQDSFCYYTISGSFADGFDTILLITDRDDQVLGIQLVDESPASRVSLEAPAFTQRWHCYNFPQARTKGLKTWCIGQKVQMRDGLVQIDSEVASVDPRQAQWLGEIESWNVLNHGKLRERVRLVLPQQIVNLILAHIQGSR